MDLAKLTLRELTSGSNKAAHNSSGPALSRKDSGESNKVTLRRCRTREQGIALLSISHAIEYLIDSRLLLHEDAAEGEREALTILLTANLGIYREGAEVVPLSDRLRQWFRGGARRNTAADAAA